MDADNNPVGFDVDIGHAIVDEIAEHYANVADTTVLGCMDSAKPNYDSAANLDDGTCVESVKIGFLLDQTSPAISAYASNFMGAAQIAIDDLNEIENGAFFELVAGDTACDGASAGAAAATLATSGVVGVAGAACSSASMGANAVLAPLGIPMVSYASTSPALSNADTYPHFFRVVPSDALQGPAMASMVVAVGMQGGAPDAATSMMAMNPALVHMTNDYGSGLAGAFEGAWLASSGETALCAKIGYDPTDATTSYAGMAQQVIDAGCGSVVTVTYSADGADFMEALRGLGSTIPAFGGDGIASEDWISDFSAPAAANTVFATKPRASTGAGTFAADCAADTACAGGIYTGETYDAITIIGKAYNMEQGANMDTHIPMVGTDYAGASGTVDFDSVGDIPGAGYDICMHAIISSTDTYLNCQHYWTADGGVQEYAFAGTTVKLGMLLDQTSPAISAYAGGFMASSGIALAIMNAAGYSNGLQFEIVYADTACDGTTAAASAQTLAAAGVVGVVGAACSSASIAANAVLAPLGIPMISYASTSPALSDDTAYPDFYRVVPSDAQQGAAMSDVITAGSSVATIHMDDDYGTGLGTAFANEWAANSETMCQMISYNPSTMDADAIAQQVMDSTCDAVVLVSYAADGEQLITSLATAGYTGAIYGGDGVADSNFAGPEGMIATRPGANPNAGDVVLSERALAFQALCGANAACAGGIYTGETFDAFIVMGYSVFAMAASPGVPLTSIIQVVGQEFVGATGSISFMPNGDLMGGSGYCVGSFDVDSMFTCTQHWSISDGLTDITTTE
jgi:branched-chain amino acid transport system substrate-binding protein